ncbi:MAG: hypothetical protein JKY81_01605 [Colwellia sp.]|nr:hypothetical protein [Colwellia sp.]
MSQKHDVLRALKRPGMFRLTPRFALLNFGCFRLAARIFELRNDGHDILTTRTDEGHAIYTLIGENHDCT